MRLFNIIKNLSEVKTQTWTPTFNWSSGGTAPTVSNIVCYIDTIGNLCCFRGRFNITNLNTPSTSGNLTLSIPFRIKDGSVATIGELQQNNLGITAGLFFRTYGVSEFHIVAHAGGGYSSPVLKTGYYAFSFFWFKE